MSRRYLPGPTWMEQDPQLRQMWQEGHSPEKIAEALFRSVAAIMTRAVRLGLPRRFSPGRKSRNSNGVKVSVASRTTKPPSRKVQDNSNKQLRTCLMCLSDFYSAGSYNRICPKCKESPEYIAAARLPDLDIASF